MLMNTSMIKFVEEYKIIFFSKSVLLIMPCRLKTLFIFVNFFENLRRILKKLEIDDSTPISTYPAVWHREGRV